MKKIIFSVFSCFVLSVSVSAQDTKSVHLGDVEAESITYTVALDSPRILSYCVDSDGNRITDGVGTIVRDTIYQVERTDILLFIRNDEGEKVYIYQIKKNN